MKTKEILNSIRSLNDKAFFLIRHFYQFVDNLTYYSTEIELEDDSFDNIISSMIDLKEFLETNEETGLQTAACYIHDDLVSFEREYSSLPTKLYEEFNKLFEESKELYSKLEKMHSALTF